MQTSTEGDEKKDSLDLKQGMGLQCQGRALGVKLCYNQKSCAQITLGTEFRMSVTGGWYLIQVPEKWTHPQMASCEHLDQMSLHVQDFNRK